MPKYIYYDRRDISGTEQQFFHESRTKATDKEYQTNMELDAQFMRDFTIRKILVYIPQLLKASTTQKDTTLDDTLEELINNGVIVLQVGTNPVRYFPLAAALWAPRISADVEYTQGTAADGSYVFMNVEGSGGLEVDITVPARTDFKFFIRTKNSVTLSNVKVLLVGEEAA